MKDAIKKKKIHMIDSDQRPLLKSASNVVIISNHSPI